MKPPPPWSPPPQGSRGGWFCCRCSPGSPKQTAPLPPGPSTETSKRLPIPFPDDIQGMSELRRLYPPSHGLQALQSPCGRARAPPNRHAAMLCAERCTFNSTNVMFELSVHMDPFSAAKAPRFAVASESRYAYGHLCNNQDSRSRHESSSSRWPDRPLQ